MDHNRGGGQDSPAKTSVQDASSASTTQASDNTQDVFGSDVWAAAAALIMIVLGLMQGATTSHSIAPDGRHACPMDKRETSLWVLLRP
jgi:hypothetical protein